MGLGRDISSFRFKVPSLDELQTFPIPIARTKPKAPTADKRTVTREPFLALRTELSGIFFLFKRISFAPTSSCWVESIALSKSSPLLSLVFSKDIKVRASPVSESEVGCLLSRARISLLQREEEAQQLHRTKLG